MYKSCYGSTWNNYNALCELACLSESRLTDWSLQGLRPSLNTKPKNVLCPINVSPLLKRFVSLKTFLEHLGKQKTFTFYQGNTGIRQKQVSAVKFQVKQEENGSDTWSHILFFHLTLHCIDLCLPFSICPPLLLNLQNGRKLKFLWTRNDSKMQFMADFLANPP